MTTEETIAQQIAVTVTPLDPTKCYFIVLRSPEYIPQHTLHQLQATLKFHGIKCIVGHLPPDIEIECIEQETAQDDR